jgi:hypothetical protein
LAAVSVSARSLHAAADAWPQARPPGGAAAPSVPAAASADGRKTKGALTEVPSLDHEVLDAAVELGLCIGFVSGEREGFSLEAEARGREGRPVWGLGGREPEQTWRAAEVHEVRVAHEAC